MILYQLIGLNYYYYVVGVEVKSVEHCDFFRLRWAELGCPPPYGYGCYIVRTEDKPVRKLIFIAQ